MNHLFIRSILTSVEQRYNTFIKDKQKVSKFTPLEFDNKKV